MLERRTPRLLGWGFAAAIVLAGDLLAQPGVAFAGLVALVVLLRTTPADAIKLRRWHSDLLIFAGEILVMPWHWSAVVLFCLTAGTLAWLRVTRRSPWWAVLIAWNTSAVASGWIAIAAAVCAVIFSPLALTALAMSSGHSRWIVIVGLVFDAVWFGLGRIRRQRH